jgi:transcriptional regulator with XRE-family HTH domain
MITGKKIKLIRTFRKLTQKELGSMTGIHEVAIRKYELGKNVPKQDQLRKIAEALQVNVNALAEYDVQDVSDIMPLLFAIDDVYDVKIRDLDGVPGIFFENDRLIHFLKDWRVMKESLQNSEAFGSSYEIWKTVRPSYIKENHED